MSPDKLLSLDFSTLFMIFLILLLSMILVFKEPLKSLFNIGRKNDKHNLLSKEDLEKTMQSIYMTLDSYEKLLNEHTTEVRDTMRDIEEYLKDFQTPLKDSLTEIKGVKESISSLLLDSKNFLFRLESLEQNVSKNRDALAHLSATISSIDRIIGFKSKGVQF